MNQNEKWYYARNKETIGPVTLADIRALLSRGEIKAGDLVYHEMLGQWTPAGKVALLQDAFTAAPPVSGPPLSINKTQPRSGGAAGAVNKGVVPPTGHMTMRTGAKNDPMQLQPPISAPASTTPSAAGITNPSAGKQDSNKADDPGDGTLFDVDGNASDPDDLAVSPDIVEGAQLLIEHAVFLDFIPNTLRGHFPNSIARALGRFFSVTGIWFNLLALLVVLVQVVTLAVSKSGSVTGALYLYGLVILLIFAGFYINRRLFSSLARLSNLGEGRIISNAVPDSLGVLFLALGIYAVVSTFATGIQQPEIALKIQAIILSFIYFGLFAFAAVTAANPGTMNMSIDASLSPASEAAGAIQYLSKLLLRLGLGFYGFSMAAATVIFLFQLLASFGGSSNLFEFAIQNQISMLTTAWFMAVVSFVPLTVYIVFLSIQFFLDFAIKVVQNTRR